MSLPRSRIAPLWRQALGALAALVGFGQAASAAPDLLLQRGPLGLAQLTRQSGLQFSANTGFHRVEYFQFRVHHQGKPVLVPDAGGARRSEFRDAWSLAAAPRPALLVHHDRWVLISDRDGQLQIEPLPSQARGSLQWADGPQQPLDMGRTRIEAASADRLTLTGGRWLLLDGELLLDVHTLRSHRLAPQVPAGYEAMAGHALGMSPDGRAIALLYRGESNSSRNSLIIVASTEGPRQQLLPIDLKPLTGLDYPQVDPKLLAAHFRWQAAAEGELPQLKPQPAATPATTAPWRTQYLLGLRAPRGPAGAPMSRFELSPVQPSMLAGTRSWLQQACGCEFTPAAGAADTGAWQLKTATVTAFMRFDAARQTLVIESNNAEDGLWAEQITRSLGERIESHLQAGGLRDHLSMPRR